MAKLRLIASQNMRCDDKDIVMGDEVAIVETIHPLRSVFSMVLNGTCEVRTERDAKPKPGKAETDGDSGSEEPETGGDSGDGETPDQPAPKRTRRKPKE